MRRIWLSALLTCALSLAAALEPDSAWESFGRTEGLSGESVTGVAQDESGFLWFSTQSGLNRWDGYNMRVWQKEPFSRNTLSHNVIQTMFLDGGKTLWLGTYDGLDRFDTATETFVQYHHAEGRPGTLSHNVVTRVYRDTKGVLWVGTLDGLNRLDETTGAFKVYPFVDGAEGLSGKTVRTLVEDALGRLWIGGSGGLELYDPAADRVVRFSGLFPGRSFPPGAVMASLRLPGQRYLWLAVWGQGLVRFDPSTGESELHPLSDPRLFALNAGGPGEIYVGTWGGGLVVYRTGDGGSFTFRHDPQRSDSLAHDVVYGTFVDRGGLLWVATNGGGLSRSNPMRQEFHFLPTPGKVSVLHEGSDGSLWAGVYNSGIVQIAPGGVVKKWSPDPAKSGALSSGIPNGVVEDARGRLWWGTNEGVQILDPRTGTVRAWSTDPRRPDSLPDEVVTALAIDASGEFWFGTYRSGLVRRPEPGMPGPVRRYAADPGRATSLPDNLVYFVTEDREHRLWVGTNGGLALYRPATDDFRVWRYNADDPSSLPSNTVRGLLEDAKGRVWVVSNGGGLSLLDQKTGKFENFGVKDGLTNLSVYSVLEDAGGQLWLASANGLFSFKPDTRTFRRYGTADGLESVEFSWGASQGRGGTLHFGGLGGILSFSPALVSQALTPPAVALTGLQVLGQSRPVTGQRVVLGWQENVVTFGFSVLDFRNPAANRYAYRLEGFDRGWIESGTRHDATYTNLWPGTYRFTFKGSDPSGAWTESSQVVTLVVEAAPWASWYAWLTYTGLAVLMVYLWQRARVSLTLGQKVVELESVRGKLEEANTRLDEMTRLDSLTGIPNRRALDLWMAAEWARALRQRQPLAVLMIDIDHFKRYNDVFGHLEGDACLKKVAGALSSSLLRTTDFCGRYGGEEFVIALHNTDQDGALLVALRVLADIDALGIPHQRGKVTVSIGVASVVPSAEGSLGELQDEADKALYRAKAAGRHRVEPAQR